MQPSKATFSSSGPLLTGPATFQRREFDNPAGRTAVHAAWLASTLTLTKALEPYSFSPLQLRMPSSWPLVRLPSLNSCSGRFRGLSGPRSPSLTNVLCLIGLELTCTSC